MLTTWQLRHRCTTETVTKTWAAYIQELSALTFLGTFFFPGCLTVESSCHSIRAPRPSPPPPHPLRQKKSLRSLNEYSLFAVHSLLLKSFERIIQNKLLDNLQGYLDPVQFAYSDATGALSTKILTQFEGVFFFLSSSALNCFSLVSICLCYLFW